MNKKTTHSTLVAIAILLSATFFNSVRIFAQSVGAGNDHTFYVCSDGSVSGTGNNAEGQLGNGTVVSDSVPSSNGLTNVIKTEGAYHSLFLKSDGTVWASGQNYGGQLGNGTYTNTSTPVQVSGLTGIIDIVATDGFSMFLKSDSTVWTCGPNSNGELGDGTTTDRTTPVQVTGLTGIIAIAGGSMHSLFLKSNGNVYSCGYNLYGQLGHGTGGTSPNPTPTLITGISNVVAVAAGDQRSLFLKNDGTVWGCGYNNNGELGMAGGYNVPTQATALSNVISIAAGRFHSAFLKNDGTIWSSGLNNAGQLGNGTTTNSTTPVQATGLSGITKVACGFFHTVCLKSDNTYWAFGKNASGQIGNNSHANVLTPIAISTGCAAGTTIPTAPSTLTLTPLRMAMPSGDMYLTWTDNSSDELGFRVERSPDGTAWVAIDSTAAGVASYTDTSTTSSTLYYYRVAAYNAAGLSAYSNVTSGTSLVNGINIVASDKRISISPNPANGFFHVSGASASAVISIFDMSGKLVLQSAGGASKEINSSSLAPGLYTVRISDESGIVFRKFLHAK